jgi:hypothetical protein
VIPLFPVEEAAEGGEFVWHYPNLIEQFRDTLQAAADGAPAGGAQNGE